MSGLLVMSGGLCVRFSSLLVMERVNGVNYAKFFRSAVLLSCVICAGEFVTALSCLQNQLRRRVAAGHLMPSGAMPLKVALDTAQALHTRSRCARPNTRLDLTARCILASRPLASFSRCLVLAREQSPSSRCVPRYTTERSIGISAGPSSVSTCQCRLPSFLRMYCRRARLAPGPLTRKRRAVLVRFTWRPRSVITFRTCAIIFRQ